MVEHPAHAFGDRQSQAETLLAFLVTLGLIETPEFLEDLGQLRLGNAGAGVPDLDANAIAQTAAAQQHMALAGIAHRVGEEVLHDASEHLAIGIHRQLRHHHFQVQSAVFRHHLELGLERLEDVGEAEHAAAWRQCPGIQLGDVEQGAEQFLGGLQRVVDVIGGGLHLAFDLLGEGRGEQTRRIQWLQQVVAGRGQKACLGGIGILGQLLGLTQCLLGLGAHAVLGAQGLVDL